MKVREDHETANPKVIRFHPCVDYGGECDGLIEIGYAVASDAGSEATVQIMILPNIFQRLAPHR